MLPGQAEERIAELAPELPGEVQAFVRYAATELVVELAGEIGKLGLPTPLAQCTAQRLVRALTLDALTYTNRYRAALRMPRPT